jgi:hypothetical protein
MYIQTPLEYGRRTEWIVCGNPKLTSLEEPSFGTIKIAKFTFTMKEWESPAYSALRQLVTPAVTIHSKQ